MPIKIKGNFRTLEELDRYRRVKLGLSIPVSANNEPPWGYHVDPGNPKRAIADDRALIMLLKASEYAEQYSLRDLAAWVSDAGYPISHVALSHILKHRVPFKEILLTLEEREKL